MKIHKTATLALAGVCLASGVALAGAIDDETLTLPRSVVTAATAFEGYMTSAAVIDVGFKDDVGVARAVSAAAAYEPHQLESGLIAYGALAALQDDAFVAGVRAAAIDAGGPDALAARLVADPWGATRIAGAPSADRRVETAWSEISTPMIAVGAKAMAASYSMQHDPWSLVMVSDPQDRLAEVKRLSGAPAAPADADAAAMIRGLPTSPAPDAQGAAGPPTETPMKARALALAAESVLGRAGAADADRLAPLFSEAESAECLKMAKLNLYQCMAVAGPQYEDVYCMAQHALTDTARCVDEAAHGRSPAPVTAAPAVAPAPPQDRQDEVVALASHRSLRIDP